MDCFSDRATNPANRDEDVDDISKFCDQVNKELEGPQTAVKLLAHKIQSPQEREALYALAVSCKRLNNHSGPEVIKLFSCSTQLSRKFILLINVKMPTIVGILTFVSMINSISERLKASHFFSCRYFSFNEQLKFSAQLS